VRMVISFVSINDYKPAAIADVDRLESLQHYGQLLYGATTEIVDDDQVCSVDRL
jgi:hypothetical protein